MLELKKCLLKCCKCDVELEVPANLEPEIYSEERNMGMQIGCTWTYEDECPHCHSPYNFEISAWEYPIGILNSKDAQSNGAVLEYDVDVVQELEDEWDDSWEYVVPSTFDEFNATILELREMLHSDLALKSGTFLKMVDAFAVTAMEAYLSGTLIKNVKENDNYLLNAAQKIDDLKNEKMFLYEVVQNPCGAKERILVKLYEFMYHNLPKIKCIYEAVFGIKIEDSLKDLMTVVHRRHDIIHRNGKDKDGVEIALTVNVIERDLDTIAAFVNKINELLNSLNDLESTIPVGC